MKIKQIPTVKPTIVKQAMMLYYDRLHFDKEHFDDFFVHQLSKPIYKLKLPMPPHRQTVHYLILLTNGSMTKKSGLNSYTIRKNSFFLAPKGQITDTTGFSKNVQGYFVHFSDKYLISKRHDFSYWINTPVIQVDPKEINNLVHLLNRLEHIHNNSYDPALIKSYLNTLLTEIVHLNSSAIKANLNSSEKIVQNYERLLLENNTKEHAIRFYADQLNITPNHLNKCVRSVFNRSASDLLHEMIILEAKVLINGQLSNVSELAFALGFEDPAYFARFFKKHTGLKPTEYHKSIDLS